MTANNADDRALLKRFSLFGPPGIIFFDAQGREIGAPRVVGFQKTSQFLRDTRLGRPLRGPGEGLLWYTARLSREVEQSGSSLGS